VNKIKEELELMASEDTWTDLNQLLDDLKGLLDSLAVRIQAPRDGHLQNLILLFGNALLDD
jgi:hypothetical protein